MKSVILVLSTALAMAMTPTMANAAVQVPSGSTAVEEASPPQVEADRPQGGAGLPARGAPPRTMRAQWPVFALFSVSWVAIVVYLIATGRRAERLAGELEAWEGRR